MALLPVVTREMSVLARRQSTYWARAVTAIIAVLTMLWLLLVSASQISLAQLGSSIFLVVSSLCFAFALLIGMQATSDCVSEEKREGTLGLLFLTDLKGFHIVFGKMAASSFNALFAILGVVPMLSLALLLGGVALQQVALAALVLLNSMFLSLSLGVFVSTLSKNERKAMFACFVGLFVLTILPFALSLALSEFDRIYQEIVFVSPLYSFICVQSATGSGFKTDYLPIALLFQHLVAWVFILAASRLLPQCIHELPPQRFAKLRGLVDDYVFGKREQRVRYRAMLLDRNPFLWLASRERIKPRYAWLVVAFFGLLLLWVWRQFPNIFFDPVVPLMIVFLIHFILKIWAASEVCSRLLADRRGGALELLLSTPLGVEEIARGQDLALKRIFRAPVLTLLIAEIAMLLFTIREGRPDQSVPQTVLLYSTAIFTLLLDFWALKWVGLWLSLFGKSIERVLLATLGRVLGLPTLAFSLLAASLTAIVALQSEKVPEFVFGLLWLGTGLAFSLAFGLGARRKFFRYFREAAARTYDPRHTRFSPRRERLEGEQTRWSAIKSGVREHWLMSGTAAILALTLVSLSGRHLYWNHRLNREIERIRARNEPASLAEMGKIYAPLPTSEDAFAALRIAGAVASGRWIQPNHAAELLTRYKKADQLVLRDCALVLTNNPMQRSALARLQQYHRAYFDPESGDYWRMPVDLSGYLALGSAEFLVALDQRDAAKVESSLDSLLHLAGLLRSQPLQRLQFYCLQSLTVLHKSLELAIQKGQLSPVALRTIQAALEELDNPQVFVRTLSVERARLIGGWRKVNAQLAPAPSLLISAATGLLSGVGAYDRQLTKLLEIYEQLQRADPALRAQLLIGGSLANHYSGGGQPLFNFWTNSDPNSLLSLVQTESSISAKIKLLMAGMALESYRNKHGCFPSSLRQLVPELLESVPSDPFNDAPFQLESDAKTLIVKPAGVTTKNSVFEQLYFELPISAPPAAGSGQ